MNYAMVLLLALWLCLGGVTTGAAATISVRADEWCPYNCAVDAPKPGYMVEVLKLIYGKAGHSVDYQTMNWARSLEETRAGKFQAVIGAVKEDAEGFVFPRQPFGMSANGFCVRKGDKWRYQGAKSFNGQVLGVIRDYSYGDEEIDNYVAKHRNDATRVQIASGDNALEVNLKKLAKGRVDVVVDDFSVLRQAVKGLDLAGQISCSADAEADPIFIAFSPNLAQAKEYAELFDRGIEGLRRDGTLKKILSGYGLEDWQ